jgi:hypothetical protein
MPLKPFDQLPDSSRLWVFPGSRRVTDAETTRLLAATDEFLAGWAAHRVPLPAGREWRLAQFLFIAADEAATGASGCSIDALVRSVRALEPQLGLTLTDNSPVWFRTPGGAVQCVSRPEFQDLADRGKVGPGTMVFDNTIETTGALRSGRWEVPARSSWHGAVFFNSPVPAR